MPWLHNTPGRTIPGAEAAEAHPGRPDVTGACVKSHGHFGNLSGAFFKI